MNMQKSRATLFLIATTFLLLLISGSIVFAYGQETGGPPPPPAIQDGSPRLGMDVPPPFRDRRPPLERALRFGPPGRWWDNPEFAAKLSLTKVQQQKMDDIFQQSRLNLIDLMANVQKQEVIMEPLLAADQPDESKIVAQIDRTAQARAELEKANARMLLGLRRVLTSEQWQKLRSEHQEMRGRGGDRGDRGQGRGPGRGPDMGPDGGPGPDGY